MADFTAGLLAAIAVLAGLVERGGGNRAPGIEVSLLGAALAVQAQRFVAVAGIDEASAGAASHAASADLAAQAAKVRAAEELEPYYRTYLAADGFLALSCLQEAQRRAALGVLGLEDPYARDPQAPPADERERVARRGLVARFEARLKTRPVVEWVAAFRDAGVPAAEVRRLGQLFSDPQALANGLVQRVEQPGVGPVDLLGSLFKVDGRAGGAGRPAPPLGAHTDEVLAEAGAAPA
jgi:crotonobetainyl-CoA:carnitine CoA-transferase CaiB-like acyl-CoA transferase